MEYNWYVLFLIFFIYAVIGYIVETISVSVIEKEAILSRGFLVGPYLPIFGFGGLIATVALKKYSNDIVALFIMSMVFGLLLEYVSSYVLEKIFKLRWWDYSEKQFNLNGRVCFDVGLLFGVAGVIIINVLNPLILKMFGLMSSKILIIISVVLGIIILTDFYLSTKTVMKLRKDFTRYTNDSSLEIKALVIEDLRKNSFFMKRLFKSFPTADDKLKQFGNLRRQFYEDLKNKCVKEE